MRKILPIFLTILILFVSFFLVFKTKVYAQPTIGTTVSPTIDPNTTPTPALGQWQEDDEVSFVGKTASRSGDFLDWTLQNYSWLCVTKVSANLCDNTNNPLISFWEIIRNIVYALIALFVLATAFILIITRGQNITIMRFIPRFIFIVLLITFSFSLVQFIYQVGDIVQDFFLKVQDPNTKVSDYITTKDLLFIGFDYQNFHGYRLKGPDYDESAFISLLLVRLTAITYYVMTGILLIRKIILWFFIIISPIFPLLIFYRPIRNTAKIWVGEFFRWLLYAPLFAIFLHGLVVVWQKGIPLAFDFSGAAAGQVVYPTAVNILLGGPGQAIGLTNSVNLRDTFAQYVVALLMLWVVILLPWLLLKIFLDYLNNLSFGANLNLRQIMNRSGAFLPGPKGSPPASSPPPGTPGLPQSAGMGRTLPLYASRGAAVTPIQVKTGAGVATVAAPSTVRETADVLVVANLTIPKMRDIARYETMMLSKDSRIKSEASKVDSTLKQIANPSTAIISSEREKFSSVRQKLVEQKQKGNPVAASVLNASQVTTSQISNVFQSTQVSTATASQAIKAISNPQAVGAAQAQMTSIREILVKEKEKGNELASDILEGSTKLSSKELTEVQKAELEKKLVEKLLLEEKKGNSLAATILNTPEVQSVRSTLENIAHPEIITNASEKTKYITLRETLVREKEKGNELASTILEASEKYTSKEATMESKSVIERQIIERLLSEEKKGNSLAVTILNAPAVQNVRLAMEFIANPQLATIASEQTRFTTLRETLVREKEKGNELASTILEASEKYTSKEATMESKSVIERQIIERLLSEEKKGNTLASSIIKPHAIEKLKQQVVLPQINHVQQVSLEDYEQVRNLWVENYQTIEPPQSLSGTQVERKEWIKSDIDKIAEAIALLSSVDQGKVNDGMNMVSNILPFLLVGGFSKNEVVAYLKAKMEAGKSVLTTITKKEEEEETMLSTQKTTTGQAQNTMTQTAERPLGETPALKTLEDAKVDAKDKPKL